MNPHQSHLDRASVALSTCVVLLFVLTSTVAAPAQILFGARQGDQGNQMQEVTNMEQWQGKKNALVLLFTNWCDDPVQTTQLFDTQLPNIWRNGNVPIITWEPFTCYTTPADIDIQIANGAFDGFIRKWAEGLKGFLSGQDGIYGTADDRRAFLRLGHEMDGNWYPWSANATQSPSDYIAMWRHVKDFLEDAGIDKWHLQFIWCANGNDKGNYKVEEYYPGDEYVDWLGVDAYDWGYSNVEPASNWWPTPQQRFDPMLNRLSILSPSKPVAVVEIGCSTAAESGTDVNAKNRWVQEAYNYLSTKKMVKMIIYYNRDSVRDWAVFGGIRGDSTYQIGSTVYQVYSGYRAVIRSSTFVGSDPNNPHLIADSLFIASPLTSAAPSIAAVSPTSGSTSGGTTLKISGTGFLSGATVTIGGVAVSSVSVLSATLLSAVTPAHAAGSTNVTVRNSDGQSANLSDAFTYIAQSPVITSVSPTYGSTAGGTVVKISGRNFQAGASVKFGGVPATHVSVTSATSISATTAPHAAGAVSVVVTNPDGKSVTLSAANLLLNPSFEKGTSSWSSTGTGKATVLNVADRAHSGTYYAEVTSASGQHAVFIPLTSTGAAAFFAVKPGQTVTFSSWAFHVSGDGYARLVLAASDGNKANPTYLVTSPDTVKTALWTLQKNTYTVPIGKAYVRIYLEIYKNTISSVARFDDVTLVTGGFTYR